MVALPERLPEVLGRGRSLGAVGPTSDEDLIAHSLGFAKVIGPSPGPLLDLGSGGGIPGLILALAYESMSVALLEAQLRRADNLQWAVGVLGLAHRVRVVRERAEVAGRLDLHRDSYQVVTARSFGAPAVVAECAVPFLTAGGQLVVSEPPEPDPLRWSGVELALPLRGPEHHELPEGVFVDFRLSDPVPSALPRRSGEALRRPLF